MRAAGTWVGRATAALLPFTWIASPAFASEALRVLSLDQCADQYVLALAPRSSMVGLSPRVKAPDSRLRRSAEDLPIRRPTSETILAERPTVVVRYWGGDARLVRALTARGVRVTTIEDASDFAGVRRNVRAVAAALDRRSAGEALVADMDARLSRSAGVWRGREALYLTPGAYTAGRGTLVDAVLRAVGLRNVAVSHGYRPVPLESLALRPPPALVLGFFDDVRWFRWNPGRQRIAREAIRERAVARLPGSLLGCPAWFAGEAAERLAAAAPR